MENNSAQWNTSSLNSQRYHHCNGRLPSGNYSQVAAGLTSAMSQGARNPKGYSTRVGAQCINTIRCLAAELPQLAKSGHPGGAMGCAPMAHALWGEAMTFSPSNPTWANRDRFILSNGHASALQYMMLHMCGYDVTRDDLINFRRLNYRCPGHPEVGLTPGVEVCTGPLGQGIANGVGIALAEAHLRGVYNREGFNVMDHFTYVICGDGCIQEGVCSEAASIAGHLQLSRLIVLFDSNRITIDGAVELAYSDDVAMKFKSYGWQVLTVEDGDSSHLPILAAIKESQQSPKPSLIITNTTIGYGATHQGTEKVHGAPLGEAEVAKLKKRYLPAGSEVVCSISDDVYEFYRSRGQRGDAAERAWCDMMVRYAKSYPDLAEEFKNRFDSQRNTDTIVKELLPKDNSDELNQHQPTRFYSGLALNALIPAFPDIMGGSADLMSSNAAGMNGVRDFTRLCRTGKYLRYGVREHGMIAVTNGLSAHGGVRPFCATYLNFLTYGWGAVRLSAMSHFNPLFICTHDCIELGEDGPSHQAVEVLALARATPNLLMCRPADGREVMGCYRQWMTSLTRPVVISLSRSALPSCEGTTSDGVAKGGYVVRDWKLSESRGQAPRVVLGATGSELNIALKAAEVLTSSGVAVVRVVSMVSWELFAEQSEAYRRSVIPARPSGCELRLYIEAASGFGIERYFDEAVCMTTFGASAPRQDLFEHFGFTVTNIVERVKQGLKEDM